MTWLNDQGRIIIDLVLGHPSVEYSSIGVELFMLC